MSNFAVQHPCKECPWRKKSPIGQFSPQRYAALAETANRSGSFPQPIFACHMSKEGGEKACAGFLLVVGYDNIAVRLAAMQRRFVMGDIKADDELYASYAEMAKANGWP